MVCIACGERIVKLMNILMILAEDISNTVENLVSEIYQLKIVGPR